MKSRAVAAGIDLSRLPHHVAVIMDGNGRWARQRGLPRVQGHYEGAEATKRLVHACRELGVEALTVYSFSTENWNRPPNEVEAIMGLMEWRLREEIDELDAYDIVFRASGRISEVPESLQDEIRRATLRTKNNSGMVFNVAINYGGRAEIIDAVRALAQRCVEGEISPQDIDEEQFTRHLYAPELPDPDLLIRTGGEMRISNFLIWQVAYAELVVLPILWPQFQEKHLFDAVREYQRRQRRFGGLPGEGDNP